MFVPVQLPLTQDGLQITVDEKELFYNSMSILSATSRISRGAESSSRASEQGRKFFEKLYYSGKF